MWYLFIAVYVFLVYVCFNWQTDWRQIIVMACLSILWPALLVGWLLVLVALCVNWVRRLFGYLK